MKDIDNKTQFECSKCYGSGWLKKEVEVHEIITTGSLIPTKVPGKVINSEICDVCKGTGRLDWVENARGEKHLDSLDSSSVLHFQQMKRLEAKRWMK